MSSTDRHKNRFRKLSSSLILLALLLGACDQFSSFSSRNTMPGAGDEKHPAAERDTVSDSQPTVMGTVNSLISFPPGAEGK
jgi:predicted small secreted protein